MTKSDIDCIEFRAAVAGDSPVLALLMNIAGEGIPAFLWSRMADANEDPMSFGARRVARVEGGFSYTHARVATLEESVVGMLLGYLLPDPHEPGPLDELPEVVRPLVELESLAPGSWYVNAVAVTKEARGLGIGGRLMREAEMLAEASGSRSISLIVAAGNAGACRLYERLGYRTVERRRIVPFPGCPHTGDWLLMVKSLRVA